ncbi:L-asparaginase [Amycolatopsis sacchari]|uniref:asparaginase n=1 Tax=Amycolatopsis sacchari TaxID=115433 RepID=A0A1I4CES0_9PSEU|nr:asparaginase [Amycolatopsis sacchari]SFK79708.1 L-asparaginase [Amycolatopsis sacchari]
MSKVVVLSTGGTIASRQNGRGASLASDAVSALLDRLPFDVPVPVEGRDVLCVGSYLLTPADMALIAREIRAALAEPGVLGVAVTHGTDTMEETAFLADLVHDDPRPVVFTGAQRPADAADTDGPRNLADAITVAADERARDRGALITFDGAVFAARGTRKTQTLAAAAFSTPDAGPVGQVREGAVLFTAAPARGPRVELTGLDARVDIVALYPGVDTAALDAVVAAGATGVVLEATGAGNGNPRIRDAVARLTADGVVVALSTRVHAGPVAALYGNGGGVDLVEAGAVPTGMLRPSQARILLTALLAAHRDPVRVAEELTRHAENPFGARNPLSLGRKY